MRRRAFLASASALLGSGLAGCAGLTAEREPDPTTRTTTRASDTEFDASLSVSVERLQPAVVVLAASGATVVAAGRQYLFYRVDVTGGEPPKRLDFAFRLGGRVYSPGVSTAGRIWRETQPGSRYSAASGTGWLVFELPDRWSARHAAFSLGSREWPVGQELRDRLAEAPPSLSVSWDAVAAPEPGRTVHEFEATNESDRDTRFVGALTAAGALSPPNPSPSSNAASRPARDGAGRPSPPGSRPTRPPSGTATAT
ncbi:MAG: hypothetical protein ABEJ88_07205 [Halobacterium sp.]